MRMAAVSHHDQGDFRVRKTVRYSTEDRVGITTRFGITTFRTFCSLFRFHYSQISGASIFGNLNNSVGLICRAMS